MIKLSEISQTEKDECYDIAYMQNLKKKERDTNEVTYKTENTRRLRKRTWGYQRGKVGRRDKSGTWDEHTNSVRFIYIYIYALLYIK